MISRDQLEFIFNGAAVLRFHTTPPLRPQTNGAHSFGVAWFCWLLTEGTASAALIMAALAHDLAEYATGDVPAHVKRQATIGVQLEGIETAYRAAAGFEFPLSKPEQEVLNLADNLEGLMFCISERRAGNQAAELWFLRWASYIDKLPFAELADELLELIFTMWEEVCPTQIRVK